MARLVLHSGNFLEIRLVQQLWYFLQIHLVLRFGCFQVFWLVKEHGLRANKPERVEPHYAQSQRSQAALYARNFSLTG